MVLGPRHGDVFAALSVWREPAPGKKALQCFRVPEGSCANQAIRYHVGLSLRDRDTDSGGSAGIQGHGPGTGRDAIQGAVARSAFRGRVTLPAALTARSPPPRMLPFVDVDGSERAACGPERHRMR